MKKMMKKNQIIITSLAIMIAAAGYLNFADENIKNNKKTNTAMNNIETSKKTEKEEESETAEPGEAVYTNVGVSSYISNAKLTREQNRARSKESLLEIVNNESLSEDQKQEAVDKMVKLTDLSEMEAEAESLLSAKGYENVVVNVSEDSVDVIMDMTNIEDADRAQIEDVIKRVTEYGADKIVITPVEGEETNNN